MGHVHTEGDGEVVGGYLIVGFPVLKAMGSWETTVVLMA